MNVVLSLSHKICRRNNLEQRYNMSKEAATVAGNYGRSKDWHPSHA